MFSHNFTYITSKMVNFYSESRYLRNESTVIDFSAIVVFCRYLYGVEVSGVFIIIHRILIVFKISTLCIYFT